MNIVNVTVSGEVGVGKSAIAGEIEILCKALGLEVEWIDGDDEKRLTHADWTEALEMYRPHVVIREQIATLAAREDGWRSPLLRYGRHDPDCATCHDSMHKQRPVCTCGYDEALLSREGWLPIESAPKDGREFIGWEAGQMAFYYRPDDCPDDAAVDRMGTASYPTLWKPSPAAPPGE